MTTSTQRRSPARFTGGMKNSATVRRKNNSDIVWQFVSHRSPNVSSHKIMISACCVHNIVHKSGIHVFSLIFHWLIGHMAQSIFDVLGTIRNILDRFQRIIVHVSIVEKRRNVLRRKNAPAGQRNNRNRV